MRRHYHAVERQLRRDRSKLFLALEQFANIRSDKQGWKHFRKCWPNFFPESEYEKVEKGSKPSIFDYPYWLDQVWNGYDIVPCLDLLLGIEATPQRQDEGTPEESWVYGLISISPKELQPTGKRASSDIKAAVTFNELCTCFSARVGGQGCARNATQSSLRDGQHKNTAQPTAAKVRSGI